jgi:hypothetical protein
MDREQRKKKLSYRIRNKFPSMVTLIRKNPKASRNDERFFFFFFLIKTIMLQYFNSVIMNERIQNHNNIIIGIVVEKKKTSNLIHSLIVRLSLITNTN